MLDVGCWMVGWMLDGWLEKAELKRTQPSLAGAWLSLAILAPNDIQLKLLLQRPQPKYYFCNISSTKFKTYKMLFFSFLDHFANFPNTPLTY